MMFKLKTKLLSVLLSAFGSGGLSFFLMFFLSSASQEAHLKFPLSIAASSLGALGCLVLCLIIVWLYYRLRVKHNDKKGIVTDIVVAILLFVPFFVMWWVLADMAEEWTRLRNLLIAMLE